PVARVLLGSSSAMPANELTRDAVLLLLLFFGGPQPPGVTEPQPVATVRAETISAARIAGAWMPAPVP
ncbi:MAG: hypothetical protein ACREJG_13340, partial [Candidatus Rokuibacteriota bacterium]